MFILVNSTLILHTLLQARIRRDSVDRESKKLLQEAGISPDLPTYGTEHLEQIQTVLDTHSIRIVYFNRVCANVTCSFPPSIPLVLMLKVTGKWAEE